MSDIISDLLTKKTPHSFLKLGKYYLMGIHVSKDLKKAESYLKKAKKSNEPKADYYLNMLKGEKTGKYPEYIENTTNYYKVTLYNNKNNKPLFNEIAKKYAEMKKKYALNISFTNAISENKTNKIIRYGADLYSYGIKKPEYETAFKSKFGKSIPLNENPEFYIEKYNDTKETDAKLAKLFLFIAVSMNNEESIILYCSNRDFYSKDHYKNIISRISNRCPKASYILGDIQYEDFEFAQSFISYSKAYENGYISAKEKLFNFYRKYKSFKGIPSNLAMFMRFGEGDKSFETEFIYKTASKPVKFSTKNSTKRSFYYAICLEHGIGVEKNVKEAIKIYENLAENRINSFYRASFYLGYLYEYGILVPQNISKAAKYYSYYLDYYNLNDISVHYTLWKVKFEDPPKENPDINYRLEVCNQFKNLKTINFSFNPNINDKIIEGAKGKTDTDSMLILAKNLSDPYIMHPDYEHAVKYLKKAKAIDSDLMKYIQNSGKIGKSKPEIVINDKLYHAMSLLKTDINKSGLEFEEIGEKERFNFYKSYLYPTIDNSYPPTDKDFLTPLEQYEWAISLHIAKKGNFHKYQDDYYIHIEDPSVFETPLQNGYLPAAYDNYVALLYNKRYFKLPSSKQAEEFGYFKNSTDPNRKYFIIEISNFKKFLCEIDFTQPEYKHDSAGKAKELFDQAIINYGNKNYSEYARLIKEAATQKSSLFNKNFDDLAYYLYGLHCFSGYYQQVDFKQALESFKKANSKWEHKTYLIEICQYFIKDKPKKYLYMRPKMARLYYNAITEKDPIHHLIFAKKCYKTYYMVGLAIKSLEIALKNGIKEAIYYLYLFQKDNIGFYPSQENTMKLLMQGVEMEEPNCLLEYGNIIKSTDKEKGLNYIRKARDLGIAIHNSLFEEYEKKPLKYFDSNEETDDIIKFVIDNISNPEIKPYVDILVDLQPTSLVFSDLQKMHQYYPKETEILSQRIIECIDDCNLIYDIGINFLSREFLEKSGILKRKKELYFPYGINFIKGNEKMGYKQYSYKGNFIILSQNLKSFDDIFNASKYFLSCSCKYIFMKYQRRLYISLRSRNESYDKYYPADYCVEGMKLINPDYDENDMLLAVLCPISDSNFDVFYFNFLIRAWKFPFNLILKGDIQNCNYKKLYDYYGNYGKIVDKITNDQYRIPLLDFLEKCSGRYGAESNAFFTSLEIERMHEKQEAAREQARRQEAAERRKAERAETWNDFKRGIGDIIDPSSKTTETKTTTYLGFITTEETREFKRGDRDTHGFKDKNTDYGYKTVNVKK